MDAHPLTGAILGERYRLGERLGGGGMGDVYIAEHVETGKRFAVKVLNDLFRERPDAVERFRREALAASRIEHENIVSVIDFGRDASGRHYLVMERLRGEGLDATIKRARRLPWPVVRTIALQVCAALQDAHALGIVHRDLKPANCFRIKVGDNPFFIKLLDFGIAKLRPDTADDEGHLTATGIVLGTLRYMAPEQADDSAHVDHRADLYSLGVIVFRLLTGFFPIRGDNDVQFLLNLVNRPAPAMSTVAPDLELPDGLEEVVARTLAKKADDRYPDMRALADALRAIDPGDPQALHEFPLPDEVAPQRSTATFTAPSGVTGATPGSVRARESAAPSPARPPTRPPAREPATSDAVHATQAPAGLARSEPGTLESRPNPARPLGPWIAAASGAAAVGLVAFALSFRTGPEAATPPAPREPLPTATTAALDATKPPGPVDPRPLTPPEPEPDVAAATTTPDVELVEVLEPLAEPNAKPDERSAAPQVDPQVRSRRAESQARKRIAAVVQRHAARLTADRVWISVTFDAKTGRAVAVKLGGNLTGTTAGDVIAADLEKLQLPALDRELTVDGTYAVEP